MRQREPNSEHDVYTLWRSSYQDKSCKEFDPEFKVEVFLDMVPDIPGEFAAIKSEYLDADNDEDMDDD